MSRAMMKALLTVALLLSLTLGGSAPARAQLTAAPSDFTVTLPQSEEAQRTLTLTNTGSEALTFCLSFGRPLEDGPDGPHLAPDALSSACGTYGEELARISNVVVESAEWSPYGLTMTPDGRLFAAESVSPLRTYELTPDLQFVRWFPHPVVEEVAPINDTNGITYNADTGTLWWTNVEWPCQHVDNCYGYERVLLLEGDFDGNPTGRRIEMPITEEVPEGYDTSIPTGAAYDAVADRYYFIDFANSDLWAIDTLGSVIEGYPVEPEFPYDELGYVVDAHRDLVASGPDAPGEDPGEGMWLEIGTAFPGETRVTRIVALDAYGRWSGIETPTPILDGGAGINGRSLRSRLDPNGVMYYPHYISFGDDGIVAVRPHPLPPSWLSLDAAAGPEAAWDGVLPPGESREVTLTFASGTRMPGAYTVALQAFEAETEAVVEVPLAMTVTPGPTAGEDEPATADVFVLGATYPNPSRGTVRVPLVLDTASEVRVVVFDVLGREVAVLAEGRMEAGAHRLALEASKLPAGVYVVRAEVGGGRAFTQRLTVVR